MIVKPFDKNDYVLVVRGVHAGKEGNVVECRKRADRHGDELVILVQEDSWSDEGRIVGVRYVVNPLKCEAAKRPGNH